MLWRRVVWTRSNTCLHGRMSTAGQTVSCAYAGSTTAQPQKAAGPGHCNETTLWGHFRTHALQQKRRRETPTCMAICLPVQRCRRSRSISATTAAGVGKRIRCGRDERSCKPANPSRRYRSTHFRAVRRQTPAASATAFGVCPLSTCRTIRSRPRGVSRAFLCMFIRFSLGI